MTNDMLKLTGGKSFLKWAGGKSKSISLICGCVGEVKGRFIEPFVGSGVVSLNIISNRYVISDCNCDLINIYKNLKELGEDFIKEASIYFDKQFNNEKMYYDLRDKFNKTTSERERSILFIYLNRHCFNGLCRYNKSGIFNVPFGRYNTVYFPKKELTIYSKKLALYDIYCQDFKKTFDLVEKEDTIYADPPYIPVSKTASFIEYSSEGFGIDQQELLADLAKKSKCKVLISNSDTEITRCIYKDADEIKEININRFISANSDKRKPAKEVLFIYNK